MRTAKVYAVGLVVLYVLYYLENQLTAAYTALSTTSFVGFVVIGSVTITVILYIGKKLEADKVV